ncbi:MAG: hypothetical protein II377_00870 [Clostridia bacterium]|nr:hypothetical protein [Clostridia bacterium]
MKKALSLLFVLLMVFSLTACGPDEAKSGKAKAYTIEDMTITLTDSFMHMKALAPNFTDCYGATDVTAIFLKETFASLEATGDEDLDVYAEAVRESNTASDMTAVLHEDGVTYLEYTAESDGDTFKYFAAVFKGSDAFWLVQFACDVEEYDGYKSYFISWAKTVEFAE